MNMQAKLLAEIERYLRRTGMSAREFGLLAKKDSHVVYRLRRGDGFTVRSVEQMRQWMKDNPTPPAKKKKSADETRTSA